MNKTEFTQKVKDIMKTRGDLVWKIAKARQRHTKGKYLLKFLWYTTNFINLLSVWKDLKLIKNETANREIAKAIKDNRETYNQLLLLK